MAFLLLLLIIFCLSSLHDDQGFVLEIYGYIHIFVWNVKVMC